MKRKNPLIGIGRYALKDEKEDVFLFIGYSEGGGDK